MMVTDSTDYKGEEFLKKREIRRAFSCSDLRGWTRHSSGCDHSLCCERRSGNRKLEKTDLNMVIIKNVMIWSVPLWVN